MIEPIPGLPPELADTRRPSVDADRARALTVACPGCGARPGQPCRTAAGRELVHLPAHPRRYRAAGITASAVPQQPEPAPSRGPDS